MGDNAEFEKLTTLEARLAAALDRIAVGLGEMKDAEPVEDPQVTSGALEDLQMRAETAEARVAELEAAAASAGDTAEVEAARDAALARVEALEVERDQAARALAERNAELEALRAETSETGSASAGADTAMIDRLKARITEMEATIDRLKNERDEARDIAEELQAASGMSPEERAVALRAEVQELRTINERLAKNVARLRSENANDPTVLNKALVVELDALKAARASEAAEIDRILAELDADGAASGGNAHA